MITAAEIAQTKSDLLQCTDRDVLMLKIRGLVGKLPGLALATPMLLTESSSFDPDDVEKFAFDLEAMVEVLIVGAEQLRELP